MIDFNDLVTTLTDSLDDLAALKAKGADLSRQEGLRLQAGYCIFCIQEQFDIMDYEYSLLLCEIDEKTAEHYKRIYLAAVRGQLERSA